ncbi:MAG: chromosomal replication initiator protein DnaA [Kiritimatiellae bacterium]|nr:chromosomal replication initiator protein DnaA [Kiritimatiellia bacterium]
MNAVNLWSRACKQIQNILNRDTYERWIEVIEPVSLESNNLILNVDNDFLKEWINDNYKDFIMTSLIASGAPSDIQISFFVKTNDSFVDTPVEKSKKEDYSARKNVYKGKVPLLNKNFTFDNFVTGPSNSFAHAAALGVCQAPGRAYNPLFIYGQTGLGKTHLMQAIGQKVLATPGMSVRYVTTETLLNEYVDALKDGSIVKFRNKYRRTDVLLIDDIQFLGKRERLQEEFFHTFNTLYDSHKQIIMTSDRPTRDMQGIVEPRLVSRFEWGLVTEIESPDFETRLAILRYKQSLMNVSVSDYLLTFIAENIKSNVRALEGALNRAISFAKINPQINLTLDNLRVLLKDQLNNEVQKDLTFSEIQKMVAEFYNIKFSDMTSKVRTRSLAAPRQVAMFICRKLTRASLPEIAKAFEKTHATIMHGCETVQNRTQVEPDLLDTIREIIRQLGKEPEEYNI